MMDPRFHTYWAIDAHITPRNLAETLYHLHFRNRDFGKLPAHVQESYCRDAVTILEHFGGKEVK